MRNAPSSENLTLRVEDFGPIIEAEIDLRPLTVFAGPSNTGKSWLATLIYALHRHFESLYDPRNEFLFGFLTRRKATKKETSDLIDWANSEIFSKENGDVSGGKQRIDLPDSIMQNISEYLVSSNANIISQTCRALGIKNREHLIRNTTKCDHVSISIMKTIDDQRVLHQHSILEGDEFKNLISEFPKVMKININDHLKSMLEIIKMTGGNHSKRHNLSWEWGELLSIIKNQYISSWLNPLNESVFYFPADRCGVINAHRAIVGAIVGNVASTGFRQTRSTPDLSGCLADFIQHLINVDPNSDDTPRSNHTVEDHSAAIEKKIIGGDIEVNLSSLIGYPEFSYRPKGWKRSLPLLNASSMVSELAPIVLFLRHKVAKGNTLIIEEPEAHLHPKMQVEFTQQLATLVQSGVRVILTTHSDWILQTLANMVCASALSDKQRSNIPSAEVTLNPEQVGVWLFKQKKSPKGSIVREMILDWESGLYDSDYDTVSEDLYRDNALIYNSLQRT